MSEKINYEKMVELLAEGLELIDRDEAGDAYRLTLLPDDNIFAERCPEWDEKNDGRKNGSNRSVTND